MALSNSTQSPPSPRLPSLRTMMPWFLTAGFVIIILAGKLPSDVPGTWRSPRICLLLAFLTTMSAQLPTTLWLHRAVTHGGVRFARPVAWILRFHLWITTGIKPWQWMYVHKEHHHFEDTVNDPHSPQYLGVLEVLFNNVFYYNRAAHNPEVIRRWQRMYKRDRWDNLFDHAGLGHMLGYGLAWAVAGPVGGLIIVLVHPRIYVLLSGAVNSIGHVHGYMRIVGKKMRFTGNSWILALLTCGEGLHENHHISPRSARLARTRLELLVEQGYWVIKPLTWLRLAEIKHLDDKAPGQVIHFGQAIGTRRRMRRERLEAA